jgi:hypothetical protein
MTRAPSVGSDQAPDLALAECRPTAASGSNTAPGGHFQPGADGVTSIVASGRAVIPGESPADTRRISSFRSCRAVDAPDTSASGRTVRGRCQHDGQVCGTRTRSEQSRRKGALVASVEDLLGEARRLDLASTEGRFRLGGLTEALRRESPAVADLPDRLAIDLAVDRDIIAQTWFVASAFPPATRRPGLSWSTYVSLRFHPARHELAERAAGEHWDQSRLGQELAAWISTHHRPKPSEKSL